MRFKSLLIVGLILSFRAPAFAAPQASEIQIRIDRAQPHGAYHVGAGSPIMFELPNQNVQRDGLFLGRIVKPSGELDSFLILEPKTHNVLYIPAALAQISDHGLENILDPYPQQGGTCTGYAIDHYMIQMALAGFRGNGALIKSLSSEEGRTGLLADAINQYYLVLQHRFSITGILDGYGKRFGFKCQDKKFSTAADARGYLLRELTQGMPVLISFNIGTQMRTTPFDLMTMHPASYTKLDPRLWTPRKTGERNGGGHSIVAASLFMLGNRPEVIVVDSDWSEPRIWDISDYLDDHTAIQEIEFITCQ